MIENGSFLIFSEKLGPFIERHRFARVRNFNSCFPWSNYIIIGTSVKALKKKSFLEVVVLSSLMLCRSQNAEKKENPIFIDIYYMYIHVTTSITTMKIKVKCKLTNHLLTKYCLLFLSPQCHKVSIPASTQSRAINGPPAIGHRDGLLLAGRWWPDVVCFLGCDLFYFSENIRFGCLREPSR